MSLGDGDFDSSVPDMHLHIVLGGGFGKVA